MESVLREVWEFFQIYILPVLPFVALVLIEVHLMYNRRENDVMFGTESFNEKIKAFEFTPKEVRTLEKLVRSSKFENKDAVLNSSGLFEAAVTEFYRIRNRPRRNARSDCRLETENGFYGVQSFDDGLLHETVQCGGPRGFGI